MVPSQDSNPRPVNRKSDAVPIAPPDHLREMQSQNARRMNERWIDVDDVTNDDVTSDDVTNDAATDGKVLADNAILNTENIKIFLNE